MRKILLLGLLYRSFLFSIEPCVQCEQAVQYLLEGNKRYVEDRLNHPDRTKDKTLSLLKKQEPFAVIVCCSDSRVSPEIIFDQEIGNLFVIRVAGNVIGPIELASIEFAALHLGSSLIFVVGHQDCGAVKAVVANQTTGMAPIATIIEPAVKQARKEKGNLLENAIKINAKRASQQLLKEKAIKPLVDQNKLKILAGYYVISTGLIEIIP